MYYIYLNEAQITQVQNCHAKYVETPDPYLIVFCFCVVLFFPDPYLNLCHYLPESSVFYLFSVVALEMLQFITFPPSSPLAANRKKEDE